MYKRFFVYGLLGWNMEIIWTGLHSIATGDRNLQGNTSLWMFLIYGSAVFILEPVHDKIRGWRWPLRGLVWVMLIWGIEFITGLFLRKYFGIMPWCYEGPLAINGLIRLDYGPAWFIAGILFERIHDVLERYRIA